MHVYGSPSVVPHFSDWSFGNQVTCSLLRTDFDRYCFACIYFEVVCEVIPHGHRSTCCNIRCQQNKNKPDQKTVPSNSNYRHISYQSETRAAGTATAAGCLFFPDARALLIWADDSSQVEIWSWADQNTGCWCGNTPEATDPELVIWWTRLILLYFAVVVEVAWFLLTGHSRPSVQSNGSSTVIQSSTQKRRVRSYFRSVQNDCWSRINSQWR
jgi:hypothetical protein